MQKKQLLIKIRSAYKHTIFVNSIHLSLFIELLFYIVDYENSCIEWTEQSEIGRDAFY